MDRTPEDEKKSRVLRELATGDCLPSLSPLIVQLLEIAADESSSASDLARIIEQDPSLTTRLIKLVNSVYYARRRTISSLSQAVVMIGFNKLRLMALSISLRDTFPLGRVGNMDYEQFWKMSLYRAIIAQGFARVLSDAQDLDDDEAFTAGLIHDVGMLMLYQVCPGPLKDSFPGVTAATNDIFAWEEENLGINHMEIGRIMFNRWHFPPQIVETQRRLPRERPAQSRSTLSRIVEISGGCAQVLLSRNGDFDIIEATARELELSVEVVNQIICSTFSRVEAFAEHLRLRVDSNRDILDVMEKANRALAKMNGSLETNLGKVLGLIADYEESDAKAAAEIVQERKKAVKDVLDAVAHEIRNPLMAIGGFAQRMSQVVQMDSDLLKYADIIVRESGRLENVLNEVVAFTRNYDPAFTQSNLIQTLEEAIQELRSLLEGNDIELIRNYEGTPLMINMDSQAIKKAMQQVLEALIQLIKKEDRKIWIEIPHSESTGLVKISIHGKGEALPGDVKEMLSGLDFSSKAFGLGFGLLLAWKTFEAHHGQIEIKSDAQTNQFVIYLPVASQEEFNPR